MATQERLDVVAHVLAPVGRLRLAAGQALEKTHGAISTRTCSTRFGPATVTDMSKQ